ncbi:oligosaccharide repeat unit polymerase [candidate division KSB1 bacterium]|nr:oligosaccharide repeat unit polymerase [candidate division KSB1 bacterium]
MEDALGPIILLTFCLFISCWEFKRFNTFVTPFGALAWPYAIVAFMINFGGKYFGFFPVSYENILFVMMCLVFFLIGGQWVISLFKNKNIETIDNHKTSRGLGNIFDIYRPLFVFLGLVSIISGIIHFYQSINEVGWSNIGSKDFSTLYGTGFLAHLKILSRPSFIFLIGDFLYHKRKYVFVLLVIMFLVIFVRQVKYQIFAIVLGGYYFCILNGLVKFSLRKIVFYVLLIFLVFNATYYIGFLAVGMDYAFATKTHLRSLNLFFTYLFGGPIAFSEIFMSPGYPLFSFKEIIAVPINIYKFLIGNSELIDIIIHKRVAVSSQSDMFHSSNVYGMVGMLYMYLGTYLTIIYMFIAGIIGYLFLGLSLKFKKTIGFQLIYSLIMAFLTVAFFDLYFNKLVFYEASFYMLTIPPFYLLGKNFIKFSLLQHKIET